MYCYVNVEALISYRWLNGDRISAVQMAYRNLWEHWVYTVGHMILWEHYCYAGDCMNVEASVLYRWLCNRVRISAADKVVRICESITFIDICINVGILVLCKWLNNHHKIRAAEMVCVILWEHYLYTATCMNMVESVLYKGLKKFVSISAEKWLYVSVGNSFFTDSSMAVAALVLYKWMFNNDRIRNAEMVV